jgi:two-component system sensor histidine kinase SenX3
MLEWILGGLVGAAICRILTVLASRRRPAEPVATGSGEVRDVDDPANDTDDRERAVPWGEVLDALRIGIVVHDPDGRLVWENDAAASTAGSRHGRVLVDATCENLRARVGDGTPARETVEFAGPPPRTLDVVALALSDSSVACLIEDTTEKRRLEQVRTDLVANISHELKTPVGALSVLAESLAGEAESEVVGRLAARMVGESQRMARTIEDLIHVIGSEWNFACAN